MAQTKAVTCQEDDCKESTQRTASGALPSGWLHSWCGVGCCKGLVYCPVHQGRCTSTGQAPSHQPCYYDPADNVG